LDRVRQLPGFPLAMEPINFGGGAPDPFLFSGGVVARMPRAHEFLIEPARLTEDNDTIRLSLVEWGAYSRIFLRAWHQPEIPGVIPAVDSVLASMAQAGAEWPEIRTRIEPLFDSTSRPGFWIAHGLVEAYELQTAFIERQKAKGILSGKSRRAKRKNRGSIPVATESEPDPNLSSVLGSRFSVTEESESNPPPGATRPAPKGATFVRPTLQEVAAYCADRAASGHRPVDPQAWFDHYTANGWRVGRNPMKDWRAAVRTWERGDAASRPASSGKMSGSQILAFARSQESKP
jgi:uncharacterized protein YdaU (DUF1376 family)